MVADHQRREYQGAVNNRIPDVGFWPLADMDRCPLFGRYRGYSAHPRHICETTRLTQPRHQTVVRVLGGYGMWGQRGRGLTQVSDGLDIVRHWFRRSARIYIGHFRRKTVDPSPIAGSAHEGRATHIDGLWMWQGRDIDQRVPAPWTSRLCWSIWGHRTCPFLVLGSYGIVNFYRRPPFWVCILVEQDLSMPSLVPQLMSARGPKRTSRHVRCYVCLLGVKRTCSPHLQTTRMMLW